MCRLSVYLGGCAGQIAGVDRQELGERFFVRIPDEGPRCFYEIKEGCPGFEFLGVGVVRVSLGFRNLQALQNVL